MSDTPHHDHGGLGYLQLPATDVAASAAFYRAVLGWSVEVDLGSFEGGGLIGQLTTDLAPADRGGAVAWFGVDALAPALAAVEEHGGTVLAAPALDQGERFLVEVADPAGNRLGLVAAARRARPQTLLVVDDVEASSRWYQRLLGLTSDHGGPDYERLLCDGELVLQLHHGSVGHHHGPIAEADVPRGNGVLVWFGEVADFDGVVARAGELGAPVVRAPHRNPPDGGGNGPGHREVWVADPDGYVVVVASPDGEAWQHEQR